MATEQHTKSCKECGEAKPLTDFFMHAGRLEPRCKPCSYARSVDLRAAAAARRIVAQSGTKTCRLCREEKEVTLFPVHRQMKGGRAHECRTCTQARQKAWREKAVKTDKHVAARRLSQSKVKAKRYGITLAEVMAFEERKHGPCDLCGRTPLGRGKDVPCNADKILHIDHCHTTGRVRGMLCGDCNRGIGLFQDDPALLRKVAGYIEGQ